MSRNILSPLFLLPLCLMGAGSEPISDYVGTPFYDVQRSVARITVPGGQATAWVIGHRYLITNEHVVGNEADALAASLSFINGDSYDKLELAREIFDGLGDWAVLRINDNDWDPVAHPPIEIDLDPQPNQVLYVIGHPNRYISRESDEARDNYLAVNPGIPAGTEGLGHTWPLTDGSLAGSQYGVETASGFSGSPVMTIVNGTHRAVGLHRAPSSGIWLFDIVEHFYQFLPPSEAGALAFDTGSGRITGDSDVKITLLDSDLAGNGTHAITVTADSGDSETVTLVESTEDPGRFTLDVPLTDLSGGVTTNNGSFEVASMDRLIATYNDADDGSGSSTTINVANPVDRRASDGWLYNGRVEMMDSTRIRMVPDISNVNRYAATIEPSTGLLAHTTPTSHTVGQGDTVPFALTTPLQLYGMSVNAITVSADGRIVVDGSSPYEINVSRESNATTVKLEETAAGLLVTWEGVPVRADSDNAAYAGQTRSFQFFWETTGELSFIYGDAPAFSLSNLDEIGLYDGSGPGEFTATDFKDLPRADSPVTGPIITAQPQDQSAASFYPVQFAVSASGTGTLSYEWFQDGSSVSGQTSEKFTYFNRPVSGEGEYYVVVTDDNGSTTSRTAQYRSVPELEIQLSTTEVDETTGTSTLTFTRSNGSTTDPLTVNYRIDGSATLDVDYSLSPTLALVGSITIPAGQSSVDVTISTIPDLEVEETETLDLQLLSSTEYILSFMNEASLSITSDDVDPDLQSYLLNFGETAYTSDGANTWQTFDLTTGSSSSNPSHVSGVTLSDTSGDSSAGLSFSTSGASATGDNYTSNSGSSETRFSANPYDWFDPSAAEQRETFATRSGTDTWVYTFDGFSASDVVDIELVFGRNNTGSRSMTVRSDNAMVLPDVLFDREVDEDGGPQYPTVEGLTGSTSYTLQITPTSDMGGCLPNAIALQVKTTTLPAAPPSISTQPQDQTLNEGDTLNLSVDATGGPLPDYQWRKDGIDLSGQTSNTLNLPDILPSDAGSYDVVVSNTSGSVTSESVTVSVNARPVITRVSPASDRVVLSSLSNGFVVDTTITDDGGAPTITWSQVSGPVGASASFTPADAEDTAVRFEQSGLYVIRVTASDGSISAISDIQVSVAPAPVTAPSGDLLAYYAFDETSGTTANDSSGNSNNATLTGTEQSWQSGRVGNAADFVNSSVTVFRSSSSFDLNDTEGFTVAAWINADDLPNGSDNRLIAQHENGGNTGRSLLALTPSGSLFCYVGNGASEGGVVTPGQWHHVAITAGSGSIKLYVDGVEVSSDTRSVEDNTASIRFGNQKDGNATNAKQWNGLIDEAYVYQRALSASEVQNLIALATNTPNAAPDVDAGGPYTVNSGQQLSLDATVSDDGLPQSPGVVTLSWIQVSGLGSVSFTDNSLEDSTVSFNQAGTYVIRLTADDGEVKTFDDVTVTVTGGASSYNDSVFDGWFANLPLGVSVDGTMKGFEDKANGVLENGLIYAFGINSLDPADIDGKLPTGEVVGNHLQITFRRLKEGSGNAVNGYSAGGVNYIVESSTTLAQGSWQTGASVHEQVGNVTDNLDGTETVTVRFKITVDSDLDGREFIRITVTP